MSAARLPNSLADWGTDSFDETLKLELGDLGAEHLPLQQGLSQSSIALDEDLSFVVLSTDETGQRLRARVGIFYKGMVAGCNCADDPSPVDTQSEYCEVWIEFGRRDAEVDIHLAE